MASTNVSGWRKEHLQIFFIALGSSNKESYSIFRIDGRLLKSALSKQRFHLFGSGGSRSIEERRSPMLVLELKVGTVRDQRFNHFNTVGPSGMRYCRPFIVIRGVDVGAILDQLAHQVNILPLGCIQKRRSTTSVLGVGGRTAWRHPLDNVKPTVSATSVFTLHSSEKLKVQKEWVLLGTT